MTVDPPRRVARGREGDHLFIYLALAGNTPFSSDEYTKFTAQMSESFYETAGSLTAALRTTADMLNQSLLNRNLATTGQGHYIVGRLILGVLRGSQIVVVQSGPTHIFCVGKNDVQHLHDPDLSGRGLGFSQTTTLYYSQLDLTPGDQLVICAQLPEGWEAALLSERGGTSVEALYRKLRSIPNESVNAAIIQVLAGKGELNLFTAENRTPSADPQAAALATTPPPPPEASVPSPVPAPQVEPEKLEPEEVDLPAPKPQSSRGLESYPEPMPRATAEMDSSAVSPVVDQNAQPSPKPPSRFSQLLKPSGLKEKPQDQDPLEIEPDGSAGVSPQYRELAQSQLFEPNNPVEIPEIKRPDSSRRKALMGSLLTGLQSVRGFGRTLSSGFQTMLRRMLPSSPDDHTPLMSSQTMAFIAIIVPLIVVVIAGTVYVRFGRSAQYDENYKLAINEAVGAIGQSDSAIVRRAWESTIYYLDRAEGYQVTQDSQALRQQAQSALDAMDLVIRLDFRPAIIGGLAKTIQIGRMAASKTDLYMLNLPQGNVLRAALTSQGYEVDGTFVCGPGTYASMDTDSSATFEVGAILDIVALPKLNGFGASLMGMDAAGTLLFCNPKLEPKAWKLEEPDIRWKQPVGFSLTSDDNTLYVLDPAGNAIWVYSLDENGHFSQAADLFFSGGFVPQNLSQAVDIAVARTDLYLLFEDGHVTHCTPGLVDANGETIIPIRCNDPEKMTDTRSGYQSGKVLSDAKFTEFTFIASTDPSLYLLAPASAAVFRFSPQSDTLFIQNQFRAAVIQDKTLFTSPITTMAISPERNIFLSSGSQVYLAVDVP